MVLFGAKVTYMINDERSKRMAVKGIERRMVQIRTPENRYFEEAHFVFRTDSCKASDDHADIMREANRILEERGYHETGKGRSVRKRGRRNAVFFWCGFLGGGVLSSVCFWILRLTQIL